MFVIKNIDKFVINKDCYEVNTRQNISLHEYQVNLAKYGKYHMVVKVFNGLPYNLKEVTNNAKKFKGLSVLKVFLYFGGIFK
jgi:hypothetical protein